MIAMIRINLLPTRTAKQSMGGTVFVAIWLALLLAVVAVVYLWYASLDEERTSLVAQAGRLTAEVTGLTDVRAQIEKRQEQQKLLAQQNGIFERLKEGKTGPSMAMAFLSYALTDREDNLYNVDELRAREDAGWDIDWDPSRLWITDMTEEFDGDTETNYLVLVGQAMDHEDVTELHRRLESSQLFYDVRLGVQEVETDDYIGARFVAFKLQASLNYNPDGIPVPASQAQEAQAAQAAAPAAKGAAK